MGDAAARRVVARRAILVPSTRVWLQLAAVTGAYVGTAKFGINLSVAHGVVTPVWAPTGISLAALLILGGRAWPAVALGAFIANVTSDTTPALAAGIAVGNTLEAVAGAYLLRRVGFRLSLERVRDVLALVALGALVSTLISATNGVTLLSLAHAGHGSYGSEWLLWWFGDAVGDVLVAPLVLVAYAYRRQLPTAARLLEGIALLACLAAVSSVVFFAGAWRYPYLIFPFLFWAALRFRQLGAATSSFVVGAIGTWGTVAGTVPIVSTSPTERVQIIQALVGVVSVSLLVVGATLAEGEAATRALKQTAERLSEAQALTHIGSWEWEIATDTVIWSDELYRIYGLEPQSQTMTYDSFLERVLPDDRETVEEAVTRAYVDHRPFTFEHRIVLPGGGERLVHARGQVVLDEFGQPVRMVGTAQDTTDRKQAETLRDDILSAVSHELRTPLTSVVGFALTLQQRRRQLGEETSARLIDHMVEQARRLERLLADLLDLERLRRAVIEPVRRPTNVADLVEQVVAAYAPGEHELVVLCEPLVADVDGAKVERIVENLVANAVRHTPRATRVTLRAQAVGEDLLIVVEDEGPGVPDELKTAVFEIFNRGAKILSSDRGTGIGLALVARFAALHGGRAWVEDGAAGGAAFHVLLPTCIVSQRGEPAERAS